MSEIDEAVERRMGAYYYGFAKTGIDEIDKILSAVACAGKAFHNTDCWTEDDIAPWYDHEGDSCVDWIQNAAIRAATAYAERGRELEEASRNYAEREVEWQEKIAKLREEMATEDHAPLLDEFRKALKCMYIECPSHVADDVNLKATFVLAAYKACRMDRDEARAEVEALRAALAAMEKP